MKQNTKIFTAALLFTGLFFFGHKSANACSTCSIYENALKQEFQVHQNWMTSEWWNQYLLPSLEKMADEVRNAVTFETAVFGTYLDAQNLMGAQRSMQELTANTLKNYTASDTICKFGTLSRSLALSNSKSKTTQLILGKRSQNRQLGQDKMAAAGGEQDDKMSRLTQFQATYCDPSDFGEGMKNLCIGAASDTRQNIDINFTRAIDTKNTLNVDLSDATSTNDEKDIMALANNLYAHRVFERISPDALKNTNATDMQSPYLDQRSIVAKRSVAENSFNALVGQKSKGGAGSKVYMEQVLQSLGLDAADATKYLGDAPSYDAQMEVLTKKLYQDPAFYANLMESPANVNRQYAALQSFGLMQKRDIFETITRSEMLLSLLLEMEVGKYQDELQNRQNN